MLYLLRVTLVAVFSVFCSFVAADFTEEDYRALKNNEKCKYDKSQCENKNSYEGYTDKGYEKCQNKYLSCLVSADTENDKRLNEVYQELVTTLKKDNLPYYLEMLQKAQRNWIKFRDDWCRYEEARFVTGSTSHIYRYCLNELTQQQIENLERSLKDRSFP